MPYAPQNRRVGPRKRMPATGVRTGSRVQDFKRSFRDNLFCSLGRVPRAATRNDLYTALALTVRDRVLKQGVRTLRPTRKRMPVWWPIYPQSFYPDPTWKSTCTTSA